MNIRDLLIACLFLLLPAATLAQGIDGPLFREAPYVLRTLLTVPLDDLDKCAAATRFLSGGAVDSAETASLYAITVDDESGDVLDDGATKVGEILTCWGVSRNAVEGPGYPTVDREVYYEFDVNGREFTALGMSRLRTPDTFLEQGLFLVGVDATVSRVVDGVSAGTVGTFSANQLVNPNGVDGYRDGAMITLRIFSAFDTPNYSALIDALRKAGLL